MEEAFEKPKKSKRKLTQKQIDALAKGRARMAEKRKQKLANDKMEKAAVKQKKEQRAVARNTLKEQEVLEKIKIREKEEAKRNKIEERAKIWEDARVHCLGKCKTVEQYGKVEEILNKVKFDDFKDPDGIENRFRQYLENQN